MAFTDTRAYQFRYVTSIPISLPASPAERQGLIAEADEIWLVVRPDVEKAGLNIALIQAQHSGGVSVPIGGVTVASAPGFRIIFKRGTDGAWSRAPG